MNYKKLSILHLLYLHSIKRLFFCFALYLLICAGFCFRAFFDRGCEQIYEFSQAGVNFFPLTSSFRIISALFIVSVSFISSEAASKSLNENSSFVDRMALSKTFLKSFAFLYRTMVFSVMHAWIILTNLILMKIYFVGFSQSLNEKAELSAKMMNDSFLSKIFVFFDFGNYLVLLAGVLFIFLFSVLLELEKGSGKLVNLFFALLIGYLTVYVQG